LISAKYFIMEALARVFSSAGASRFSQPLRAELTEKEPLVWEEALYASYIKREIGSYVHNSTRASVAITPESRLVVMAAGHKQIDVMLSNSNQHNGLQIWIGKVNRIHFKTSSSQQQIGLGGFSLEIRIETKNSTNIMMVIDQAMSAKASQSADTHPPPPSYNTAASMPSSAPRIAESRFSAALRTEILTDCPLVFEENRLASTVLRQPGNVVNNQTRASVAITQSLRLIIVPQGEDYCDFPLTLQWCRNALRVWLEGGDQIVVFELQLEPFQAKRAGESREIRIHTTAAKQIEQIINKLVH
jgi:hypothetical protein